MLKNPSSDSLNDNDPIMKLQMAELQIKKQSKKKKQNGKNAYIRKINQLTNSLINDQQSGNKKQIDDQCQNLQNSSNKNNQDKDKLERNRKSAQNSRKRKKYYQELLEKKVTKLQYELEDAQKIKKEGEDLVKLLNQMQDQQKESENARFLQFSNLKNIVQQHASEGSIDYVINTINKRFGVATQERYCLIDHYVSEIQDNTLAPLTNHLLYALKNNLECFDQKSHDGHSESTFKDQLKISEKQKKLILKKKNKLVQAHQELNLSFQQLNDIKQQIHSELNSFDQTLESLRKELKPSQVGKFLMQIKKFDQEGYYKRPFEQEFGSDDEADILDLSTAIFEQNQNGFPLLMRNTFDKYRKANCFLKGQSVLNEMDQNFEI